MCCVKVAGCEAEGTVLRDLHGVHGLSGDYTSSEESREEGDDHVALCVKIREGKEGKEER